MRVKSLLLKEVSIQVSFESRVTMVLISAGHLRPPPSPTPPPTPPSPSGSLLLPKAPPSDEVAVVVIVVDLA